MRSMRRFALAVFVLTGAASQPALSKEPSHLDCLWRICGPGDAPHAARRPAAGTQRHAARPDRDPADDGNLFSHAGHSAVPAFAGPGAGAANAPPAPLPGARAQPTPNAPSAVQAQNLPRIPNATADNISPPPEPPARAASNVIPTRRGEAPPPPPAPLRHQRD